MRKKSLFTLSESTTGLLKRMENASRYLDELVQARQQRAMQSLEILHSRGWNAYNIEDACAILNGRWKSCLSPRGQYPKILLLGGFRQELMQQVSESESTAYALHEVVSEFWCGNTVVEEAIK